MAEVNAYRQRFKSIDERFWEKVDRRGPDDCWPWLANLDRKGYGRFHVGSRTDGSMRNVRAHQIAYELEVGPIPEGLTLDHRCHTADGSCPGGNACLHRRCANPAHLQPATSGANTLRGLTVTATNAQKSHCHRGHEFTAENTYRNPNHPTARSCRQCIAERGMAHRNRIGERNIGRTHCPQGHPYDEANAYVRRNGQLDCRTCHRERERGRRRGA